MQAGGALVATARFLLMYGQTILGRKAMLVERRRRSSDPGRAYQAAAEAERGRARAWRRCCATRKKQGPESREYHTAMATWRAACAAWSDAWYVAWFTCLDRRQAGTASRGGRATD